mgnify:CR=1 FL=1
MRKWTLRLAGAVALAVVLVALLAWLTLRASLPTLDGSVTVAGLDAGAIDALAAAGVIPAPLPPSASTARNAS